MMFYNKFQLVCCALVMGCFTITRAGEPRIDHTPNDDSIRFMEIQKRFLDIVGNSSSGLDSLTDVMGILNTDVGKEIGSLIIEGFSLGMKEKDSTQILGQLWTQLQDRLSPTLVESFDDYKDFLKGVDMSTLPIVMEQLFKKDDLGNSLAGIPLGQLVDMVQPTASKYGIDIKAMMNSLMGHGENNARDLILSALSNIDFSALLNQVVNVTTNAIQTTDDDMSRSGKMQGGSTQKKSKADKTLRLFRPLVASLLKGNGIDLDADAVLEVISPLFKSDIIAQAAPWIAMLAGQSGEGGLGSVISSLMGGDEGFDQQQLGGLLGGLGALMAAGGNDNMDMTSIINMASMFMGKPSKKKNSKSKSKTKQKNNDLDLGNLMNVAGQLLGNSMKSKTKQKNDDLDLGNLMNVAGQLLGDNMNMDSILDFAANALLDEKPPARAAQKVSTKNNEIKKTEDVPKVTKNIQKTKKKSKTFLDLVKPILVSMKTDKQCNVKIKNAIDLGKVMVKSKIASFGNLEQILPQLISYFTDSDTLSANGVKLESLVSSFSQNLAKADWREFLEGLENKDFRQVLINYIAPNAADVLLLVSKEETQAKIYDAVVPRAQGFIASYGLVGVTLDNFPERLAPMLGLLSRSWNLPFNPTTLLVPLKVYLKELKSWMQAGLEKARPLNAKEAEKFVIQVLEEDVAEAIVSAVHIIRDAPDLTCLPQKFCQVGSELDSESLKAAVLRNFGFAMASEKVLETTNSELLLQIIEALSDPLVPCKTNTACDQVPTEQDEDTDSVMDLKYEHQEL